jgi:L-rhamnose mutarotase
LDAYVDAHAAVWPEMLEEIARAGISNYSLFLSGHTIFGYMEGENLSHAWEYLGASSVNARWQDAMAAYLDARVDSEPGNLPEIFHID